VNRLSSRVARLERSPHSGWRWWEGRPLREWPDHALLALIGDAKGWPPDYVPSDDVLRAIAAEDGAEYGDGTP
jgi:hypothetical protein